MTNPVLAPDYKKQKPKTVRHMVINEYILSSVHQFSLSKFQKRAFYISRKIIKKCKDQELFTVRMNLFEKSESAKSDFNGGLQ